MAITNADLQRLWDDAWDLAPEEGETFRAELRKQEKASGRMVSGGSLANVSKNSASQSYGSYGPGNITQAEIPRAWRDLINLFDRCKRDLVDDGTAEPTDAEVYESGRDYLSETPTEARGDYAGLRSGGGW